MPHTKNQMVVSMLSTQEFEEIEHPQSHSYILFTQGTPYVELGWEVYRPFKSAVDNVVASLEKTFDVVIYQHDHEFLDYAGVYLWWFSFLEGQDCKRIEVAKALKFQVEKLFERFEGMQDKSVLSQQDDGFYMDPSFANYYCELVVGANFELKHIQAPVEKMYTKPDLDLAPFEQLIKVQRFKEIVGDYVGVGSMEDFEYFHSPNGFFSTRRSAGGKAPNKLLREELLPSLRFINHKKTANSAVLQFGLESDNFDLKIVEDSKILIVEITWAIPLRDFELLSWGEQRGIGSFPMRNLAKLKSMIDSMPAKIAEAIKKKHDKNYPDQRTLLVVIPVEYTYQGENTFIEEMLKEVKSLVAGGKRSFDEVLLLCGMKFFTVFPN